MCYKLFFHKHEPALGILISRSVWDAKPIFPPVRLSEHHWFPGNNPARFGYGGCGRIVKTDETVTISTPIEKRSLCNALSTFGLLLSFLNGHYLVRGAAAHLEVSVGLVPSPSLYGKVSPEFKECLDRLRNRDLQRVEEDMRACWKAIAKSDLKLYARDCRARTGDGRFSLTCFGNACDVSVYPDSDPEFTCHNLDTAQQQATLLAGIASLHAQVTAHGLS